MQYADLKINPDMLFKDMGDEGILLNSITSSYYRINAFGVKVLNIFLNQSTNSFSDDIALLIEKHAEETGELPDIIERDMNLFLEELKQVELLICK